MERFIEKAKEKYGERYDYSKVEYRGCNTKISIKCIKHNNDISVKPAYHLAQQNAGCVFCKRDTIKEQYKKRKEQNDGNEKKNAFIEKAKNKFGTLFDYSNIVKYDDKNTKINITCTKHNETINILPLYHLRGIFGGCLQCKYEQRRLIKKEDTIKNTFLEKAKNKFGTLFDYSKIEYKGCYTKIDITCTKHNEKINITPAHHILNKFGGCFLCSKNNHIRTNKSIKVLFENFLQKAKQKYDKIFDYSNVKYKNFDTEITIKCIKHNIDIKITPAYHLETHFGGCLSCQKEQQKQQRDKKVKKEIILKNKEILKDVVPEDFKDLYQVSSLGRVFSKRTGKELTLTLSGGYYYVHFQSNTKTKKYAVHYLVYTAFKTDYDKKKIIEHSNNIKTDNRIENLLCISQSQNVKNAYKYHFSMYRQNTIQAWTKDKKLVKEFETSKEAQKFINHKSTAGIMNCLLGKKPNAGGYVWTFKDKKVLENKNNNFIDDIQGFVSLGKIHNVDYSNYLINKDGIIINTNLKNRKLKIFNDLNNYKVVYFKLKDRKNKRYQLHRLIAKIFLKDGEKHFYDKKMVVNHLDKDKNNCIISNLEWCSYSKNSVHSIGKKVARIDKNTNQIIKTYNSLREAFKDIGKTNASGISAVCQGIKGRKIAHGFKWKYI